MNVYVVTWWSLSGVEETTEIMAVFSSRKKAYEYVDKHKGHPANNEWTVEERELDKEDITEKEDTISLTEAATKIRANIETDKNAFENNGFENMTCYFCDTKTEKILIGGNTACVPYCDKHKNLCEDFVMHGKGVKEEDFEGSKREALIAEREK